MWIILKSLCVIYHKERLFFSAKCKELSPREVGANAYEVLRTTYQWKWIETLFYECEYLLLGHFTVNMFWVYGGKIKINNWSSLLKMIYFHASEILN